MNYDLEDTKPNVAVGVLGMHRSGTSCLSGCLEECGLYLGDVVNFAKNNRKGNKENLEFRAINNKVLDFSGGAWDRPPEKLIWNDELREIRDAYLSKHNFSNLWGVKDPRMLLTLPFWEETNVIWRWVGTFRHPSAVVASLEKRRNLIPATPSLQLWRDYNTNLLNLAKRYDVPLVSFDVPRQDYLNSIEGVVKHLGLPGRPRAKLSFFDDTFRHHETRDFENSALKSECLDIYDGLLNLVVAR